MNVNMHPSPPGPLSYQGGHSGFQGPRPERHGPSNLSNLGQGGHYPQHQTFHGYPTLPAGNGTLEAQKQNRIPSSVEAAGIRENQHYQAVVRPPPAPNYHVGGQNQPPARSSTLPDPLHFQYMSNRSAAVASTSSHPRLAVNTQAVRHSSNPYPQFTTGAESPSYRRHSETDVSSGTTPHRAHPPSHPLPVSLTAPTHRPPSNPVPPPPPREGAPPTAHSHPSSSVPPPNPSNPPKPSDPLLYPSDPFVATSCEAALNPVRAGIESVWNLTVKNVRDAMNKMNQDYVKLTTAERTKNTHLMHALAETEAKLTAALEENKTLRQEKQEFVQNLNRAKSIMGGYKEELARLRAEKEKLEVEYRVLAGLQKEKAMPMMGPRDGQERTDAMNYMNSVVSAVSEQVARQMEEKMTAVLNEVQEQQTLRLQAEQKVAEAFRQLEQAGGLPERPLSVISRPESISIPESHSTSRMSTPVQEPPRFAFSPVQDRRSQHMPSLSSPHILSGAPSLKRLSSSSCSSVTHVDSIRSPTVPKHQPAPDSDDVVDLTSPEPMNTDDDTNHPPTDAFVSSPTDEKLPLSSPVPPSSSPIRVSTAKKRSRAQYEEEDEPTDQQECMAREAPPAVKIKSERLPEVFASSASSSSSTVRVGGSSERESVTVSSASPPRTSTEKEVGEVLVKSEPADEKQEYEEGEVVDEDVEPEHELGPETQPETVKAPVHSTANAVQPAIEEVRRPHYQERLSPKPDKVDKSQSPPPQQQQPPQPPPSHQPPAPRAMKLGISHIDLLYRTDNKSMTCRMCITRRREVASSSERRTSPGKMGLKIFPTTASWSELITHCQTEHPKACQDLERLAPGQIAEMKQRMKAGRA
ncbi:unnamed protein product [Cyclocybe aegerita]|uniref:Uncharacterized protein n=1 Tax=Cyclocybe aegerita TaxID=1973307 RepID=A0A8S0VTK9_CYCAE|nr:unnamed protein product [Cyclocybe aegerita]